MRKLRSLEPQQGSEATDAPSGAMLWIFLAAGGFMLFLALGLYMALAVLAPPAGPGDAPSVDPRADMDLPDATGQQMLVALTHAPQTGLAAEGHAAIEGNSRLPFSRAAIIAARPFSADRTGATEREKAELCMTQAIYYEAGFEPLAGKRAVAQTILNRVRHPAFPRSVCGVVYEGAMRPVCQFSFTCDGALARRPAAGAWAQAREVARAALDGYVERSVGLATHYHADYVLPRWAPELAKVAQIGAHIFYRWPGGWGTPRAFTSSYSGIEAVPLFNRVNVVDSSSLVEYPPVAALPERRTDNDLGGRVDVTKGWTPNIPLAVPGTTALARVQAAQVPLSPDRVGGNP